VLSRGRRLSCEVEIEVLEVRSGRSGAKGDEERCRRVQGTRSWGCPTSAPATKKGQSDRKYEISCTGFSIIDYQRLMSRRQAELSTQSFRSRLYFVHGCNHLQHLNILRIVAIFALDYYIVLGLIRPIAFP